MEYGILGPLTVSRGGRELRLGGAKQRSVLAVLLLRANELVPTARIVDELWGERPPPTAVKAVQVQVSKLRKLLDEGALETRPTGYLLRVEPGALDLERFQSLLDRGRERLAQGNAREAGELLRDALGLWRGSPLAEFEYEAFARNEIGRLEELRLAALELRLEADLALGRHTEIVGELEGLVRDHPLRESLARLLILALYRAGRQADALVAYQDARTRLLDELGLDPSQALQQLEKQILLQDQALDLPAPAQAPAVAPSSQAVAPDRARPKALAARKIVSVVCCDVAAYDAGGGLLDPEALQLVMSRCFERAAAVVERHGGIVERASDRELMAVFGVPAVHEDDALRAVRAAVEIRDTLPEMDVQARIGVTTGEVLAAAASGGNVVTGDPVAVAKRLELAAAPGEVLIGEATLALIGPATEVESIGPLELPGRGEPVAAYRVLLVGEGPEREHGVPFVGRERELALLRATWERVSAEQRCELVTVVGDGGVGKSRLTTEALASVENRVVHGRCLPYGEGITYWPVVEVVEQLDAMPSDDAAAAALRSLLGESDRPTSADEIAWAFRKLLEEQAPLVVCFDDLQWGEETFLDLVESTGLLSAGKPLLLLCMARPELLERRPSWPAPLRLEPLPPDEADALIGQSLPEDLRRRIADRAGGNPLFITEMLALATAGGELEVPPTLRALLAARLDQLEPRERSLLERGAVEGEVFHRGAVQALAPEESEVLPRLAALVRHGLIRPERPQLPGEDAFRFRHLLMRDAAYDGLPKAVRADLHRRFADWLEDKTAVVELDELLGYHLEQAARYQAELSRPEPALALRAGDRLLAAGVRALGRDDERAAAGLLERALSLTRPLRSDVHAELDLAQALWHEPERAARIAEQAALRAGEADDETGEALARAMAASFRLTITARVPDELETLLLDARRRLEKAEDHVGLMYVWSALGYDVAGMRGRYDDWATASEQALHHSRLAGRSVPPATNLGAALVMGSRPADEALAAVDRLLEETGSSWLVIVRAWLLAMLDRGDEAWKEAQEADARLRDQSTSRWGDWYLAEISTLAGDHEEASRRLRIICDWLEATEDGSHLSTYLPLLGRSLCMLGRFDEAEQLAKRAHAIAEDDPMTQVYVCQVLARVHAHRGELAEAERLAREAVAESERTDSLNMQAEALCDLGEALAEASRPDEAAAALEQALDRCLRKKNLALARQVGERLVELRAETQPA